MRDERDDITDVKHSIHLTTKDTINTIATHVLTH